MRPTPAVAARVEELLREELLALGEHPARLAPDQIAAHMVCEVQDDYSLTYIWKGTPILHARPEADADGVTWRMFTREDPFYSDPE